MSIEIDGKVYRNLEEQVLKNQEDIEGKQDKLTAGTNITIQKVGTNTVISSATTATSWGSITGTLSNQTDLQTALNNKANTDDLADVATSGSYDDLSDKPTIPTVNNPTITLTQGGTTKGTFTLNQAGDATIDFDAGGTGTVDFNSLTNRPSYNGAVMTNATDIPEVKTATWDAKSVVSGTNDGTNWSTITIDGDTYSIPSGGGKIYMHNLKIQTTAGVWLEFVLYTSSSAQITSYSELNALLPTDNYNTHYINGHYYTTSIHGVIIGLQFQTTPRLVVFYLQGTTYSSAILTTPTQGFVSCVDTVREL